MRKIKNKSERKKEMMMIMMICNLEAGGMIKKKGGVKVLEIETEREKVKEIILQDILLRHRNLHNHHLRHHHVNHEEEGGISTVIGGRLYEASTITVGIIINAVVIIQNPDQNHLLLKRKLPLKNQQRIQLNIGIKSELTWELICCDIERDVL